MLRIKPETSMAFDAIKADVSRVQTALVGVTNTVSLALADEALQRLSRETTNLRMALRRESAALRRQEREFQMQRKTA